MATYGAIQRKSERLGTARNVHPKDSKSVVGDNVLVRFRPGAPLSSAQSSTNGAQLAATFVTADLATERPPRQYESAAAVATVEAKHAATSSAFQTCARIDKARPLPCGLGISSRWRRRNHRPLHMHDDVRRSVPFVIRVSAEQAALPTIALPHHRVIVAPVTAARDPIVFVRDHRIVGIDFRAAPRRGRTNRSDCGNREQTRQNPNAHNAPHRRACAAPSTRETSGLSPRDPIRTF